METPGPAAALFAPWIKQGDSRFRQLDSKRTARGQAGMPQSDTAGCAPAASQCRWQSQPLGRRQSISARCSSLPHRTERRRRAESHPMTTRRAVHSYSSRKQICAAVVAAVGARMTATRLSCSTMHLGSSLPRWWCRCTALGPPPCSTCAMSARRADKHGRPSEQGRGWRVSRGRRLDGGRWRQQRQGEPTCVQLRDQAIHLLLVPTEAVAKGLHAAAVEHSAFVKGRQTGNASTLARGPGNDAAPVERSSEGRDSHG